MKQVLTSRRTASSSMLVACALLVVGCGQKSDAGAPGGQWVAKVNEREITVHQVNAEMAGAAAAAPAAQGRTVEALVERRLLVDAATRAGSDRAPDVALAIEKAKEQIIAQAYLRQLVGTPKKPSAAEVTAYFNEHPELFARRKQYEMRQVVLDSAAFSDEVKRAVDGAAGIDDVEATLTARNVKFVRGRSLRTGADLPPAMLGKVDTLSTGKPFVVRTPANVVVATLSFVKDAPVTQQEAAPQIEQYLANAGAQKLAAAEIARLRKEAKVEYKSGFGPEAAATTAAAGATAAALDRAASSLH